MNCQIVTTMANSGNHALAYTNHMTSFLSHTLPRALAV